MTQDATQVPRDDEPLRDGTSLIAYLHILKKAHAALVGHDRAHQRFGEVVTRGQAKKYIAELMPQLLQERDVHRRRRGARHHGSH
ncbi:hypothetical protein [Burkholderia ubonensis]|uniref:Uncharacterized protein n=1 Tax=Burkholderia ubonensis subsp. mesacidophila TaxID=265293 RepID=A0A2A4FKK2_9BURK|nr:hypothetical protein [Burkholderia ubonensis]PCE33188.1 hypothetical protein BZL54_06390 [Burkholderia ubonensis subsp. mesacidophila]